MNIYKVLEEKTIGIAGVGGLGSNIATLLTRMRVGHLVVVDYDIVEAVNLNRQNYFLDQINQKKVTACKEVLERINNTIHIETHDLKLTPNNIKGVFKDVDIIIEAFDLPEEKAMLTEFVLKYMPEKILIGASGIAGYESNNTIITKKVNDRFYLVGDLKSKATLGMYGPRVNIVAAMQANTAIRVLMGEMDV
ncbi:MAG TPA: sulfur carrier protein ThiS adenylyltransferase ThiF [Clostridia bacterium]|nr:sulfur carrier protein ThiS adenylyltransferase ThiF [Clostridia bacterium]